MVFKQFIATNGDAYIFVGKNETAIMLDTNYGTEFGGEKFTKSINLTLDKVMNLKNYQIGVAAVVHGTPSFLISIEKPSDSK